MFQHSPTNPVTLRRSWVFWLGRNRLRGAIPRSANQVRGYDRGETLWATAGHIGCDAGHGEPALLIGSASAPIS